MLETQKLIIKPLNREQLEKYVLDPGSLASEMGLNPPSTPVAAEVRDAILNDLLPNLSDPLRDPLFYTLWIIIGKKENAIVGSLCFHGEPDESMEVEIGYGTDNGYRNRGFMTEAIAEMAKWAGEAKTLRTIRAVTEKTNTASVRILEKNGFRVSYDGGIFLTMKLKFDE